MAELYCPGSWRIALQLATSSRNPPSKSPEAWLPSREGWSHFWQLAPDISTYLYQRCLMLDLHKVELIITPPSAVFFQDSQYQLSGEKCQHCPWRFRLLNHSYETIYLGPNTSQDEQFPQIHHHRSGLTRLLLQPKPLPGLPKQTRNVPPASFPSVHGPGACQCPSTLECVFKSSPQHH